MANILISAIDDNDLYSRRTLGEHVLSVNIYLAKLYIVFTSNAPDDSRMDENQCKHKYELFQVMGNVYR